MGRTCIQTLLYQTGKEHLLQLCVKRESHFLHLSFSHTTTGNNPWIQSVLVLERALEALTLKLEKSLVVSTRIIAFLPPGDTRACQLLHHQPHNYLPFETITHNIISDDCIQWQKEQGKTKLSMHPAWEWRGGGLFPQAGYRQCSASTLQPTKVNAQIIRTHLKVQIQD